MTPETQKALEAFVIQIMDTAKSGAAWTAEQTPLLVQEWLQWQLAEATISLIIFYIFAALLAVFAVISQRKHQAGIDSPKYYDGSWAVGIILGWSGAGAVFFITSVTLIPAIVKVWIAPRVIVFEKFMEILK